MLGLALMMGSGGAQAATDVLCAAPSGQKVDVREVVDGRTIVLADGRVVRLAGISLPAGERPGQQVRAALAALVEDGALTAAFSGATTDRYGRWHASFFDEQGRPIAEVLVRMGLARVELLEGEPVCLASLLAAEDAARKAAAGSWDGTGFVVRKAVDASLLARSGLYEVVEGRVVSVGHGRGLVFLDFGRNYRRDFTIMVPLKLVEELPVAIDSLMGRRVRVRGVIEDSGGPAIRLERAGELEVLEDSGGGSSEH
jgi:endonuclease YncB( thermonuclease family)